MWSNYENIANILESCFKYVLIDKALLASMVVIEHMDGRALAHKHLNRLPSPGRTLQEDRIDVQKNLAKEISSGHTNVKQGAKAQGIYDAQDTKENPGKGMDEKASPSKQKIGTTSSEATIEQEINEVFDDTSRLETELFATMEEKARLEDELIVMKDYVNKLRSNMFHLKIERANLESDLKRTAKSFDTLSDPASIIPQKEHFNNAQSIVEDYRGLKIGELSDVTEASYESTSGGESENGSHVSERTEQGSQVLKNCLASMTEMYSLMPNPDDDTLTEGDDSDGKGNASLSENDIDDSDEEDIIITKIAREMQDFHAPSLSKDKTKDTVGLSDEEREQEGSKLDSSSTKTIKKQAILLKNPLEIQKSNKSSKILQIAYEDLEDELYHVRGQLSKAQQIILNLESQLIEEKGNWEQIRKLYLENKDKNDVLEGKVAILREELEKSLRENTFLKDYHKVEVVEEGQNKAFSNSTKSPLKSPSRRKVFDLRSIPSIQNSNREMQIIKLLEENTELKTRNEKLSEEKMLAEHHSREKESKVKDMEERIRHIEEGKRSLQEQIETLQRRKAKLGNELLERREESFISSTELDLYSKESERLEKELAMERNMVAKLRQDNSRLAQDLERIESELCSWKIKEKSAGRKEDQESVSVNEGLQMVFIDDCCSEEEKEEINKLIDSHKDNKDGKTVITLQKEINSMAEYHEALEKEYNEIINEAEKLRCDCQAKTEHIKSLEHDNEHLRRQMMNTSKITAEPPKTILSRLHLRTSPIKTKKEDFDVHERYEESARERNYKNTEDLMNTVKQENSELRQKIRNSEQKIAIYEADLEKAMLKIKQLQEYRISRCLEVRDTDPNCKLKESNDLENYSSISAEMMLSKANKEIERLQEQLLDKDAENGLLHDELHLIRLRKDELDKALDEAREARTELQEKMEEMGKCTHFEDTVKELTEKNQQLEKKLRQSEETTLSAVKKQEKQNEALRKLEEELVCVSGEKLKSEFEMRNVVIDMEKTRNGLEQSKQELKLLQIELNEKIERSANLEIQLLELKCSNECMKSEIDQLNEKTRLENHQNQEQHICKETMEKRLQETFVANNQLQSELHKIFEENKYLNEKLCKAQEWKENAEEQLNQVTSEKKQLEGKVKKLDDTKRKMEEELKRLRENTNILQGDLGKIEKQQEETNKKCSILEKEIKRKTKELEGKTRDIRRLRKELSSIKEERNLVQSESTASHCEPSNEVKKIKAKAVEEEEEEEEEKEELVNKQFGAAYRKIDCSNQQVGSENQMSNTKNVAFLTKDKDSVTNTAEYNEIGWDFENDTVVQDTIKSQDRSLTMTPENEKHIENQPQTKQDLSDEVGWDLNDSYWQENSFQGSSENSNTDICTQKNENRDEATQPSSMTLSENKNKSDIYQMQQQDEEMAAISAKASVTQISKEKLLLESETARLLESKTSHLTKTQMSLEQSLSKALGENKRLLDKLNDSRVILERIKSRVSKLEEQNDCSLSLNRSEAETQTTKMAEFLTKETQIGELTIIENDNEVVVPVMEDKENEISEVNTSSSKAILYLTREKKQVAKELEITKRSHEEAKKELQEKEKYSLELKQELKTLRLSQEEEKQSLLKELEMTRGDYNTIKRKLKEQEEYKASSEELKEKQIQAERLIIELEKDLVRQTEEKAILKGKLSDCQNKLKELEILEQELRSLRNENKQMSTVQEAMGQQIEHFRKENQELLERVQKRKQSWNMSRQRRKVAGRKKEAGFSVGIGRKTKCMTLKEKHTKSMQNRKNTASSESRSSEESDDYQDENDHNAHENTMKQLEDSRTDNMQNKDDKNEILDENETRRSTRKELDTKSHDNERDNEMHNPPEALVATTSDDIPTTNDTEQTSADDTIIVSGQDLKSDEEAEEEANIELKLSKILKERQMMEEEMQTLLQEMNNLKARFATRQLENNSHEKDDHDELRTQLEHLQSEKNEIQEQVVTLKTINTKLEVELSDALDVKLAMEAEITRMRTARQKDHEKAENLNENNKKLESMLAIVMEENSTLYQDVSALREKNQVLKSYNIREIVDGSTQVSPRTTEDEADSNSTSPTQKKSPESAKYENKTNTSYSKALLELPIKSVGYLMKYRCQNTTEGAVKPLSASSPDTFGKVDSGVENTTDDNCITSCESKHILSEEINQEQRNFKDQDRVAKNPESAGDKTMCSQCRTHDCQCRSSTKGVQRFDVIQKARNTGSNENPTFESLCNDHDLTSGDVLTDSSFASVTDFEDISFSSDWVSAEDLRPGHSTSKGHRGINKMHREMAEIKCTNTILENELTIMKNRNSDFQAQLQKLAGKNNSLKQKICDRSLAIKKAEREMTALTEEKMRLEVQVSASKEEINRLERDRGKLERSLSNSKAENKRLKNDLAMARAESYKTKKTLVNLEADYKKLQTEFEDTRDQLTSITQLPVHKNTTGLSTDKQHLRDSSMSYLECVMAPHDTGECIANAGVSLPHLTTSKSASVRRVSSDQTFNPSSEPKKSLENFHLQERKFQRQCKSQMFPTAKEPTSLTQSDDSESSRSETNLRLENQMSYSSNLSFSDDRDRDSSSHSDEVVSCEHDDKKVPQSGIKKMFKRFSKSKKTNKSFSS